MGGSRLADRLWTQFGELRLEDLPADVVLVACQCVLDWLGCALAGSRESLVAILRDELATSPGPARLVGGDERVPALTAALVNGAAGHALDYDDTHLTMSGHPTAPVLPALLAHGEEAGCSGAELLAALVAGIEVECRVAALLGPEPYRRGWHSTMTMGIIGAAAASARLLGLDREGFGHALGLAASQAGGLKASFGTMTKPFHAGHAAERGLLAARLARRGFTANPAAVEASQGLAEAAGAGASALRWERLDELDDRWLIGDTLFKYHAACYLTHAAIESADALRRRRRHLDAADAIDRLEIELHPSLLDVCAIAAPRTGLEAKFSIATTTAMGLLGRETAAPQSFDDSLLADQAVTALAARAVLAPVPSLRQTEVRVTLHAGGSRETASHDSGVPATDLASQQEALLAKFLALATPVLDAPRSADLAARVLMLRELESVRDLLPSAAG